MYRKQEKTAGPIKINICKRCENKLFFVTENMSSHFFVYDRIKNFKSYRKNEIITY